MRRHLLAAAALLGAAASAAPALAQAPQKVSKSSPGGGADSGAFVVRLGTDTTAVERWTRTALGGGASRLEGDVVNRTPYARVTHYAIDLDAAGRPTRAELRSRQPDGSPIPRQALGVTYTFRGDSAFAEVQFPDSVGRLRAAAPAGTMPAITNSFAVWETVVRAHRAAGRDSGAIRLWGGGPQVQAYPMRIGSARETIVTYFGDPVALHFDPQGRMVHIDGSRSTNKQEVVRVETLDVAAVARSFGARPAMGQTSPRDTTRATLGAAQLLVDYGRPSARGRTVWGGTLVPHGAIWRTGANAATTFVTSADLVIGGQPVPAGTYTLYTWPTAQGYQLVINKQTKQWGTEYKPEMDLVRVPLTSTPLSPRVEQFTIAIEPAGANAATLALRWDDRQLAVPVTVK